jgi:hypothetical protein
LTLLLLFGGAPAAARVASDTLGTTDSTAVGVARGASDLLGTNDAALARLTSTRSAIDFLGTFDAARQPRHQVTAHDTLATSDAAVVALFTRLQVRTASDTLGTTDEPIPGVTPPDIGPRPHLRRIEKGPIPERDGILATVSDHQERIRRLELRPGGTGGVTETAWLALGRPTPLETGQTGCFWRIHNGCVHLSGQLVAAEESLIYPGWRETTYLTEGGVPFAMELPDYARPVVPFTIWAATLEGFVGLVPDAPIRSDLMPLYWLTEVRVMPDGKVIYPADMYVPGFGWRWGLSGANFYRPMEAPVFYLSTAYYPL